MAQRWRRFVYPCPPRTQTESRLARVTEPREIDLIIETARRAADDANLAVEFMERDDLETALTWAKSVQEGANTLVLRLTDQLAKQQNPKQ